MSLLAWTCSVYDAFLLAKRQLFGTLVAVAIISPAWNADSEELKLFSLGSGEVGGGYFAAAKALCESVNRSHKGMLRCSPEATSGSLYNLAALRDGQLDFALVQSDWQKFAFEGTQGFANAQPMDDLRSVMSLYPETITVLAARGSGIESLADLLNKRVDIGHPASGRRATLDRLLKALDIGAKDFAELHELPTGSAAAELCAGEIDATILITGHPSEVVARSLRECGASVMPLRDAKIDAILEASKDYVPARIPASAYRELPGDVPSYAVMATMVTRSDMPDDIVEALVTDTLNTLPELGRRAPVIAGLNHLALSTRGLTAPLHPGAAAAYEKFEPP